MQPYSVRVYGAACICMMFVYYCTECLTYLVGVLVHCTVVIYWLVQQVWQTSDVVTRYGISKVTVRWGEATWPMHTTTVLASTCTRYRSDLVSLIWRHHTTLYLRYCRTGVVFHSRVYAKDQYVTTYDDVKLVEPNRIRSPGRMQPPIQCTTTKNESCVYTLIGLHYPYGYNDNGPIGTSIKFDIIAYAELRVQHLNCLDPSFLPGPLRTVSHSKTVRFY